MLNTEYISISIRLYYSLSIFVNGWTSDSTAPSGLWWYWLYTAPSGLWWYWLSTAPPVSGGTDSLLPPLVSGVLTLYCPLWSLVVLLRYVRRLRTDWRTKPPPGRTRACVSAHRWVSLPPCNTTINQSVYLPRNAWTAWSAWRSVTSSDMMVCSVDWLYWNALLHTVFAPRHLASLWSGLRRRSMKRQRGNGVMSTVVVTLSSE